MKKEKWSEQGKGDSGEKKSTVTSEQPRGRYEMKILKSKE